MTVIKCTFCGKEQEDYKGVYLIKNDSTILYFSSGKCLKNYSKLKRDRKKIKWTEAFREVKNKKLSKEKEQREISDR